MKKESIYYASLLIAGAFSLQSCITVLADDGQVYSTKSLVKKEKELKLREQALQKREAQLTNSSRSMVNEKDSDIDFGDGEVSRIAHGVTYNVDMDDAVESRKKITLNYNLSHFSKIKISGVANVVFTQGNFKVSAVGDERSMEILNVEVKNNTLVISNKKNKLRNVQGVTLYVTAPTLNEVTGSGVGSFNADKKIKINGSLYIDRSGVGSMHIGDLTCNDLTVIHSGVGGVNVNVTAKNITIKQSGVGGASYHVNCDNLNIEKSGVGGMSVSGTAHHYTNRKSGFGGFSDNKLNIDK